MNYIDKIENNSAPIATSEQMSDCEYQAACANGLIKAASYVEVKSANDQERQKLLSLARIAILNRSEQGGKIPISSPLDCDASVDEFAARLSIEPVQYLQLPPNVADILSFSDDTSFDLALRFVREKAGSSVQYGWLLYGNKPSAHFHAAVKDKNGKLHLIDPAIPHLAFEHTIAFLPDMVNKPDYEAHTVPCDIFLGYDKCYRSALCLRNVHRELNDGEISYEEKVFVDLPLDTPIFKAGLAPHRPSKNLDLLSGNSIELIMKREKARAKKFRELVSLVNS